MKTDVWMVVVIYNKSCADSLTCQSIVQAEKPPAVWIVDNSTKDYGNAEYCKEHGWRYLSMQGNAGLSKAYNAALAQLGDADGLVIWADDDTCFPPTYFMQLTDYAQTHPQAALFLPVVRSGERWISPCIAGKYRVHPVESMEQLKGKPITAINSGMAARLLLYQDYRYDENLFLDCIDHDFMRWCRQNDVGIKIMEDVILQQSFFADSRPQRKAALFRRKLFVRDFRTYSRKCGHHRLVTELQLLKGRIRLELTSKR